MIDLSKVETVPKPVKNIDKYPDNGCLIMSSSSASLSINRKGAKMLLSNMDIAFTEMRIAILPNYNGKNEPVIGLIQQEMLPNIPVYGSYKAALVNKNLFFRNGTMKKILLDYFEVDTSNDVELFFKEEVDKGVFTLSKVPPLPKGEDIPVTIYDHESNEVVDNQQLV